MAVTTTGDAETDRRIAAGQRPDRVGWKQIAGELGVHVRTALRWEVALALPLFAWGTSTACYADRLRAAVMRGRRAA